MIRSSLSSHYQVTFIDTNYTVVQVEDYESKICHFWPYKSNVMLENITVLGDKIDAKKIKVRKGWIYIEEPFLIQSLGPYALTSALHPNCAMTKIWLVLNSKGRIYSIYRDDAIYRENTYYTTCLNSKLAEDGLYEDYESSYDFCDFMRWLEGQLNWAKNTEQINILLNTCV
jgi:hypothetical protein